MGTVLCCLNYLEEPGVSSSKKLPVVRYFQKNLKLDSYCIWSKLASVLPWCLFIPLDFWSVPLVNTTDLSERFPCMRRIIV